MLSLAVANGMGSMLRQVHRGVLANAQGGAA
jgi:hypothetical protein